MGRRLVNEFSWSHSRDEHFERCLREYYFRCYGSWEGWQRWSSQLSQRAYRLKKLESRYSWLGKVVHQIVSEALLKALWKTPLDVEQSVARLRERLKYQWLASRNGERNRKDDVGFWGLVEHEYREPIPKEEWAALGATAEKCVRTFYAAGWPERVASLAPEAILSLDDGVEFSRDSSFTWRGVEVWAKPDLAFRDGDGALVVDWKTGKKKEEHRDQVAGYAFFLREKHGIAFERVRTEIHYLASGEVETTALSAEAATEFESRLERSINDMKGMLVNPEKNVPKPMEAFPMTEDKAKCRSCSFRRLCGRE